MDRTPKGILISYLIAFFIIFVTLGIWNFGFKIEAIYGSAIFALFIGLPIGLVIGAISEKYKLTRNREIFLFIIYSIAIFLFFLLIMSTTIWVCGNCGINNIPLDSAFVQSCTTYRNHGCFSVDINSSKYAQDIHGIGQTTLAQMCAQKGYNDAETCSQACGCITFV